MAIEGKSRKPLGLVFLGFGAGLAFRGYQKSKSMYEQLSSAFAGSDLSSAFPVSNTADVMMIVGSVCLAIGLFLVTGK